MSPAPGRRPGDGTIPIWCEGKGLCIDVAVTCPLAPGNLGRESPCEYFAENLKHRKYDASFRGTNYDFSALVFESTGGVNREGSESLSQVFRFAARSAGKNFSVYAGRGWAKVACTLQSAVAQAIINRSSRVSGVPPAGDSLRVPALRVSNSIYQQDEAGSFLPLLSLLLRALLVLFLPRPLLPPVFRLPLVLFRLWYPLPQVFRLLLVLFLLWPLLPPVVLLP